MNYTEEELIQLINDTLNPTHKEIYGNHLKRLQGKKPVCVACTIDEPAIHFNPINQQDEE